MFQVHVRVDTSQFEARLARLSAANQAKAMAAALNKTAERARTQAVRDITRDFVLTATEVRDRLQVIRASSRGRDRLESGIRITGKRAMNLIRFVEKSVTLATARRRIRAGEGGTMALKGGGIVRKQLLLRVKVKRSGSWTVLPGAFVGNNGRTVFRRIGAGRLPIEALTTVDVPQLMISEIGQRNFRQAVGSVFPNLIRHEIKRLDRGYQS